MGLPAFGRGRRGIQPAPDRDKRDEWGQAAVELALVLPLVLLLLIGLVQLGLIARDQVLVTHAAREAVRAAAVGDWEAASTARVARAAGLDPARLAIRVHRTDNASDKVVARLSYRSPVRVVLVGRLLGEVTLGSHAVMRRESGSGPSS